MGHRDSDFPFVLVCFSGPGGGTLPEEERAGGLLQDERGGGVHQPQFS